MTRSPYPSDLSDAQWERLALLLPPRCLVDARVAWTCGRCSPPSSI